MSKDGKTRPFGDRVDQLKLRGADSFIKKRLNNINMAFARLAIVDQTRRADQPFFGDNEEDFLLFNGEIYNYLELKKDIEKTLGLTFKTNSDTEVLYQGVKNFGKHFLARVNGIFAFVYYNLETQQLLCARDEFGVKPLYFYESKNHLIFSSELGPIAEITKTGIKNKALAYFLSTGTNYEDHTIYEDVKTILPNQMVYSDRRKILFFEDIYQQQKSLVALSNDSIIEKVEEAVKIQIPQVRFGVQFSGGIDSTVILSILNANQNLRNIFSVNIDHEDMSESKWQKRALEILKARHPHYVSTVKAEDLNLTALKKLCTGQDLPYFHPNYLGADLISKEAKMNGLKVLFSGEGADEIFGGYRWFREDITNQHPLFYNDYKTMCKIFEVEPYNLEKLDGLTKDEFFKKIYLQRWLTRSDLTGMKHSVEVRVPFLDRQLSAVMPENPDLVPEGRVLKEPLKICLQRRGFNNDFLERRKMGFDFPLNDWIGREHEDFIKRENSYYDRGLVSGALSNPSSSFYKNRSIFTLSSFLIWAQGDYEGG